MNIQNTAEKHKKTYQSPQLEIIDLDKDISLTMSSLEPPFGPSELITMYKDSPTETIIG